MTKRSVLLLCLSALLVVGLTVNVNSSSERARPTVAQINGAINSQGACWVAKDNKFSTWTTEQLKRLLGVLPSETEPAEPGRLSVEALQAEEDYLDRLQGKPGPSLPTAFDWRASGGVTSVKDQGNCGSCWAFGSLGQLEALLKIYTGATYDLSEQFLVSCETDNFGCDGGYMDRVYNYLKSTGAPNENCFGYKAADLACNPCADWASQVKKISAYTWVCRSKLNTNNIKSAVYSNGPLTVTMDVYNDFFNYSSGCYSHVTGAYAGGHSVLIVGWTADGCWIVKNSWGPGWGEQGYFKIKFGNCRIGGNSAKFTL